VRAVVLITEGTATSRPELVIDLGTRRASLVGKAFTGAAGVVASLPSLGLMPTADVGIPTGAAVDATLAGLVNVALLARAHGVLAPSARIAAATVDVADPRAASTVALDALLRMSGISMRPEARRR